MLKALLRGNDDKDQMKALEGTVSEKVSNFYPNDPGSLLMKVMMKVEPPP